MDAHFVADQSEISGLLARPSTHGIIEPVLRIDTHGAAVFLAGRNAYEVKRRPLSLPGLLDPREAQGSLQSTLSRVLERGPN
jgi:hypothetical protein